jgi:hypothetical protein
VAASDAAAFLRNCERTMEAWSLSISFSFAASWAAVAETT